LVDIHKDFYDIIYKSLCILYNNYIFNIISLRGVLMGKKEIEEMAMKLQRTGQLERARWLQTIDQKIPPLFKRRIIENDKSVLRELIMPSWVTWDFLRDWALEDADEIRCSACGLVTENFTNYKNITICNECLENLRKM